MQRITTTNAVPDLFGPGKAGFRDGDLVAGTQPTNFNAAWPNGLQEEVAAVIEAAGIELDGAELDQLLTAIQLLITARFAGANHLLAQNGFQRLPGGFVLQWGIADAGSATPHVNSFPTAFPTGCFAVVPVHYGTDASVNVIVVDAGAATFRLRTDYPPNDVTTQYVAVGF